MQNKKRILRLDARANPADSASNKLGDYLLEQLQQVHLLAETRVRDLNQDLSFIDANWIAANFTAPGDREPGQSEQLSFSDRLIEELEWADHIVLTTPMYNFGVPATLKAWIDMVCRAGVTFRYAADGPQGLLQGKRADIIITTGGVPLASPVDFVSGYLKQVFAFIGINEDNFVGADQMNVDAEASFAMARSDIVNYFASNAA